MARCSAELLIEKLERNESKMQPLRTKLPVELIVRQSCGCTGGTTRIQTDGRQSSPYGAGPAKSRTEICCSLIRAAEASGAGSGGPCVTPRPAHNLCYTLLAIQADAENRGTLIAEPDRLLLHTVRQPPCARIIDCEKQELSFTQALELRPAGRIRARTHTRKGIH
jgi:hypothetical protein